MISKDLTQEELRNKILYNYETGTFTRKGKLIGYINNSKDGYLWCTINYKPYALHRLAWFYIYGKFPDNNYQIDHINGDRLDNRICNLRAVTARENNQNRNIHRLGKLLGTSFDKNGEKYQWAASFHFNRKQHRISNYKSELEAHDAYVRCCQADDPTEFIKQERKFLKLIRNS